jgi:hypothetical protein
VEQCDGDVMDVVAKLADAARTPGAWCRLEEILEDGGRRPVFVNAGAARRPGRRACTVGSLCHADA